MKYVYIVAMGTAKELFNEKELLSALTAEGLPARDIHELPRVELHDIAITSIAIAKLIKDRFGKTEKPVKILGLVAPEDMIAERLARLGEKNVSLNIEETNIFVNQYADYCIPSEDLAVATKLIANIVKRLEAIS